MAQDSYLTCKTCGYSWVLHPFLKLECPLRELQACQMEISIMSPNPRDPLLVEREKTHGSFEDHARITQTLKNYAVNDNIYDKLNPRQCEALDMIFHKIGRIGAGNPNWKDHWDDIAGYAKLGSEACE